MIFLFSAEHNRALNAASSNTASMNEPYLAKGLLTQGHMWQTIALGKTIKIPISVQRQLVCQSSVRQMRIMFTTLKACSILLQPVTNAINWKISIFTPLLRSTATLQQPATNLNEP